MTTEYYDKELQIEENIKWTERSWVIQRIGWTLLGLFVFAAAIGVFGDGILSKAHKEINDYSIDYERFGRLETSQKIKINAPSKDGRLVMSIPQSFMQDYDIPSMVPQPLNQHFNETNIIFEYPSNGPVMILLEVEPQNSGRLSADFKINNQVFTISQFIYP